MTSMHDQNSEWALIELIRKLRECDPRSDKLRAAQAELISAFEDDVRKTAGEIRARCASYRVFQLDRPGREGGILENHLRMWIIARSVAKYDPCKNDSFAKYVFFGWRTKASIQEYLKEFKLPARPAKDDEGKIVDEIVRLISINTGGRDSEGGEQPIDIEDEQGQTPREIMEIRDAFLAVAGQAGLTPDEMLRLLKPLAFPFCQPEETDEYRRRKAMLVLIRDDVSCPDRSDEFKRRQLWNSLAAER